MKAKKLFLCAILVVTAMLITTNVYATTLPWLDFGSNLIWNSNTNTLTSSSFVTSVTYRNGTTVPPPFFPPSDGVLYSPVTMSISFDGNNTNDFLNIGGWLSASLDVTGPTPNPLGATPNPYIVNVSSSGLTVNTGAGSQWADEFDATLDYSLLNPARLNIAWLDSYIDLGNGIYKINSNGKLAPIPEPGTLMLLGSGLMGVAFYRKRKK